MNIIEQYCKDAVRHYTLGKTYPIGFWVSFYEALENQHGFDNSVIPNVDAFAKRIKRMIQKIEDEEYPLDDLNNTNVLPLVVESLLNRIRNVFFDFEENQQQETENKVIQQHDKKYYYNDATGQWIFWLKSSPTPFIIHDDDLKSLKSRYSNWDGEPNSLNSLARDFGIPRKWLVELFRILNITHDSDPFLEAEILNNPEDVLVEELLQIKRRNIYQKIESAQWDEIKRKARLYDELEVHGLKPLTDKILELIPSFEKNDNHLQKTKPEEDVETCFVFSPTDIHYGKLPFMNDGYDSELFEKEVLSSARKLIEDALKKQKVTKIVALSGSDFFHIDNTQYTTSNLTSQAGKTIGTYHDIMVRGYLLAIKIWDILVDTGIPVHTVNIAGNHDKVYSLGLGLALEQRYRHVDSFSIDNSVYPRKFASYGKNLFVFEHGEHIARSGSKRELDMMSTILLDAKEQGINIVQFENYFYFTGHYHKRSASHNENYGIMDIIMPSLSTTDMWHHDHRYMGNKKTIASYIFDKENLCSINYQSSNKLSKY